ncbi:MAG: BF3164 family lipoprotein [Bergeyella sp.]
MKKIGKLPKVANDEKLENITNTKFPRKAYIFKAISVKNPTENNKVAVFYNKTDRIEFYYNDKLTKIVSQENFNPKMQVTKLEKGFVVEDSDKTKYAYLSVIYAKNYIYALYSGSNETSSNSILVFDWNGNFIKELFLNRKVCKIFMDSKNNILYCYEDKEKGIFSANLNF